jgi:hypothetical protein
MTPQEKAESLVETYYSTIMSFLNDNMRWENAKKCALIAVDEIISHIEPSISMDVLSARIKFWNEVKQEIEKL